MIRKNCPKPKCDKTYEHPTSLALHLRYEHPAWTVKEIDVYMSIVDYVNGRWNLLGEEDIDA